MKGRKAPMAVIALCCTFAAGAAFANDDSQQPVTDTAITTKVKAELARDDNTKARNISVKTQNGIVRLSGKVDSAAEKQQAEQDASSIDGVVKIDNQLIVTR